jgi:hypothetical protein
MRRLGCCDADTPAVRAAASITATHDSSCIDDTGSLRCVVTVAVDARLVRAGTGGTGAAVAAQPCLPPPRVACHTRVSRTQHDAASTSAGAAKPLVHGTPPSTRALCRTVYAVNSPTTHDSSTAAIITRTAAPTPVTAAAADAAAAAPLPAVRTTSHRRQRRRDSRQGPSLLHLHQH